jgi:hypothetical protein
VNIDKIVVVTKKTPLEELVLRLNSVSQARFYLEQNGVAFAEYEQSDAQYRRSVEALTRQLPRALKQQLIDRDLLPTYQFGERDLVVTLGPDGLVINTAKYLSTQPILALNPDPARIDGVLIAFQVSELAAQVERVRSDAARVARLDGAGHAQRWADALCRQRPVYWPTHPWLGALYAGVRRPAVTGAWQLASYFNESLGEPPKPEPLLCSILDLGRRSVVGGRWLFLGRPAAAARIWR